MDNAKIIERIKTGEKKKKFRLHNVGKHDRLLIYRRRSVEIRARWTRKSFPIGKNGERFKSLSGRMDLVRAKFAQGG